MSSGQTGSVGGGLTEAATAEPTHPGRIQVRERVLRKVAEEASASTIGVDRSALSVTVTEYGGGLALGISTPLPIPDLTDTAAVSSERPILERLGEIQHRVKDRVAHLSGRDVTRVNITVTGATIPERRRVR